jgi:protein-S-isoprenylcysteine O-methyltransferase Ste14
MRRVSAVFGSAGFFLIAPATVAVVIPWRLTGWSGAVAAPRAIRFAGAVLIAGGTAVLVSAFAQFAFEGSGTPAPIAPTERLVVGGLYRYVRNPMYLSVLAIIAGQAAFLFRRELVSYGLSVAGAMVAFVRLYEEPTLRHRYGAQYEGYRRAVPGWLPRLSPWRGE